MSCFLLVGPFSSAVLSDIRFQEVTASAGIVYTGPSYGAAWGDFDGDGLADLWVNNHLGRPDLYHNNGDGTFTDILTSVWFGNPTDDTHGPTWGDFDNDGDQDLIELVGAQGGVGQGPNHLYVNQGGVLIDMATTLGVDYPLARGRTASWLDWNNDGLLDLLLSSRRRPDGQAPSALFEQIAGSFQNASDTVGFAATASSNFAQLADFTGDGILDLIVHGVDYPQRVYDMTQQPFVDMSSALGLLPKATNVWDAAVADVNGDLRTDLFLTRVVDGRKASDVFQESDTSIKARLRSIRSGEEKGIRFRSAGDVLFDLYSPPASNIFIGASGQNPAATPFTLSASDPSVWGIKPHVAGTDAGNYIGYDPATQVWQWLASSPGKFALNGIIQTVAPATEVGAIGFDPDSVPLRDRLLIQTASGFIDQTIAAGLDVPTPCYAVAAGDLDNDMDVDLYLVCNRPTANLPNMLYENLGNGEFVAVANAGGAAGSTLGRGENVALADYDGDGFLDLFVTNGLYTKPFNEGPQQLFRNEGNANHWIEMDLEGSVSNRDGIGAQIRVTAGGVTQLRERNGGVHRHAQNHKRIHFGLASNTTVDTIEVRWPSGSVQQLNDIPADQVLLIQEDVVSLSIDDVLVDERAGTAAFTVNLSQPSTQTVTVSYATVDGTAIAGEDYLVSTGELVFLPGETQKALTTNIIQDSFDEPDETFEVTLTNAVNAVITGTSAVGTITRFPIWFQEVTQGAGLPYSGQTYGGAWGDFNADGQPDLFAGNHQKPSSLYINQGDGTFADQALAILPPDSGRRDRHSAAWADFDNDGDQDLIQVTGARTAPAGENRLYVNAAGVLTNRANELGVAWPEQLARTPLWFDWNRDGLLDLMVSNMAFELQDPLSLLVTQTRDGFEDATVVGGQTVFSVLSDLSGNGHLEIIFQERNGNIKVVDVGVATFKDIAADLNIPAITSVQDLVTGDLNGDLRPDLFVVRGQTSESDLKLESSTRITVRSLVRQQKQEQKFSFRATGDVLFTLYRQDIQPFPASGIYVGAGGVNPAVAPTFSLSPNDSSTWGLLPRNPGVNDGVRIGYDPDSQRWTVSHSAERSAQLNGIIEAAGGLWQVTPVIFDQFQPAHENRLLIRNTDGFSDQTGSAGLAEIQNCTSGAAADFDNDMDLDLYVVCSGILDNLPNQYYENLGDGTFSAVPLGAGAEGTTVGRGDSVVVADYDQDGFLDVFVNNGMSVRALTPFNGPQQLFRNMGNGNHWLEVDLEGQASNRDAVGAIVWVSTPDGRTQMREQNGRVHRASQDHQRIHVGLGGNTKVTKLAVDWPSGFRQEIANIVADQVVEIIEHVEPDVFGQPDMTGNQGGIFIWKDSPAGPYHLRVKTDSQSTFGIKLVATEPLLTIDPFNLGGDDSLQSTEYGFSLRAVVNTQEEDGVDFSLSPGARAMISVERDGVANPRQLHVGALGAPLSPVGWIKPFQALPLRPNFLVGQDLGLFVGQGPVSGTLEARLSGDGPRRASGITLIASVPLLGITPVKLDKSDILTQTASSIDIKGWLGPRTDGIDLSLVADSDVGIVYRQDNLTAPLSVNPDVGTLGPANAYWLPAPSP